MTLRAVSFANDGVLRGKVGHNYEYYGAFALSRRTYFSHGLVRPVKTHSYCVQYNRLTELLGLIELFCKLSFAMM